MNKVDIINKIQMKHVYLMLLFNDDKFSVMDMQIFSDIVAEEIDRRDIK